MRLPLSWLADWVELPASPDARALARRLTLAGFEVEAIEAAAAAFSGVVVAKILSAERHPQADKLQVCRVTTGAGDPAGALQIVCGAPNARAGLVTALATVGAVLPGDAEQPAGLKIRAARLRGVESAGMLCSARELGLGEGPSGILELPADAPLGEDLRDYLALDDTVLEVNVTPNRGDAMSVLGIAREVAALTGTQLKVPPRIATAVPGAAAAPQVAAPAAAASPAAPAAPAVSLQPRAGAGRFLACTLRGVDNSRPTPVWLRERLRRAGQRCINPVVDVTNYVMLELGQPMHAYDRARLQGALSARRARDGERLELLDGREVELDAQVLVIADEQRALGLAGIMGGAHSAVSAESTDITLEVAWFAPAAIAGRARRFGLTTDASQRFERGVDWRGQERALALALHLIGQIAGGTAGPVTSAERPDELPHSAAVALRASALRRLVGLEIPASDVERPLRALGMDVRPDDSGWQVRAPSWRFDIAIEADLIEEVVRLGGLDTIPEQPSRLPLAPRALDAHAVDESVILRTLAARGYQEIISFAFVDPALQALLFGEEGSIRLANPIAADMAVMRRSLWPGLLKAAGENLRRSQSRLRLFELGRRFLRDADGRNREQPMLAGLVLGSRLPEQWGAATAPADFHDLKSDVEALLALAGQPGELQFEPTAPPCLHPGRSARIMRAGTELGYLGELHPSLVRALDLTYAPLLFELDYGAAFCAKLAHFRPVSRFQQIRRDIAVVVPDSVTFAALRERVTVAASSLLQELRVFDLYQGTGIEPGRKSVALGLILQDLSRTLTDDDADRIVQAVVTDLKANLDARIRE